MAIKIAINLGVTGNIIMLLYFGIFSIVFLLTRITTPERNYLIDVKLQFYNNLKRKKLAQRLLVLIQGLKQRVTKKTVLISLCVFLVGIKIVFLLSLDTVEFWVGLLIFAFYFVFIGICGLRYLKGVVENIQFQNNSIIIDLLNSSLEIRGMLCEELLQE